MTIRRDANAVPNPWLDPLLWLDYWKHDVGYPNIESFAWLREEARETWHYFEANIVEHCLQNVEGLPGSSGSVAPNALLVSERYANRDLWFEIALRLSIGTEFAEYYVIVECSALDHATDRQHQIIEGDFSVGTEVHLPGIVAADQRDKAMLVDNVKLVQEPKGMLGNAVRMPSVVRLERLDNILRRRRTFADLCLRPLEKCGLITDKAEIVKDGECRMSVGFGAIDDHKLPDKMIQGRAQVVNEVSYNQANGLRNRRIQDYAIEVLSCLTITLSERGWWIETHPCGDLVIDRLKVIIRPFDLSPWPVEWMRHEVQSAYGQDAAHETGSGDTDSQAQGLRRHPQRRREAHQEAEGVTGSTPEEVAPQTDHTHRSGGYSATRTRLGSPEDA